jgi:N-formylglutamate deformylase
VDELIADAPAFGIPVLLAAYPRCFIDLNRALDDIDPELLDGAWPTPLAPTEKSRRGLGLIRRFVSPGVPVHDAPLPVAEVRRRIDTLYVPYHNALDTLLEETRRRHGFVWLVDWHSMKSIGNAMTPDGAVERPDFVVGDLDGGSAAPRVTAHVVDGLRAMGYRVAVNDPYRGGTIVRRSGDPENGEHSVQGEIKRSLYLEEATVGKTAGFGVLRERITTLARSLADAASAAATQREGGR